MAESGVQSQDEQEVAQNPADASTQEMDSVEPVDTTEKEPTELDKYWKAVKDNATDFTGWTYLLQYVEQEPDVTKARDAFDAFLERYPYCYGYWKKYADLEKKHENFEQAIEVFERGLEAIPLSIDLWIHYINCATGQLERSEISTEEREEKIRSLFERAITASGTDFKSDKLWDMYIFWEKEHKNLQNVTALYDRVLAIPTQLYSHQWEQFQEHVKSNHPKDILTLDEFLRLRQKVLSSGTPAVETTDVAAPGDEDAPPPGAEPPPGEAPVQTESPPGDEAPPGMEQEAQTKTDDDEAAGIREKIIELRESVHRMNEQEVSRRWSYEEGVRRPYFHVKPLERVQLKNWRDYLEFEISNGTHERAVVLFERCLIATALYEEFWIKYANYMEPHSVDGVRHIFTRACKIHLTKKPTLHLGWAGFEERQGNHQGALEVLETLEANLPGLVMVSLRIISLERRMGNFEKVEALYKKYIDGATDTDVRTFYSIKYARYQAKIIGNQESAKAILEAALEKDKTNVKLYLQLIDLEFSKPVVDEHSLNTLFDQAIASQIALEHRVAFSQRRLEFLEDFSCNVGRIIDAYEEHQKLLKESQATVKKRKTDEDSQSEVSTASKKTRIDSATSQATANGSGESAATTSYQQQQQQAYPNSYSNSHYGNYNQSGYNYGQTWPGYGGYGYPQQGWGAYGSHYYGSQ